ncbi:ABC transporter ATP-binding protein [Listeria booriae]|uniref:ABC transporter ATP-binding protein n=1 Tax=Listeria booriae TaxID=1552123 RepID=UPI00162A7239|nr:ATP-binding cassette domain-containing protein [Listeria booriae]MBC1512037.1 ATP-binding cassette domain-containing protein [Listeria booriae]MBC6150851.1 ATP-binding cassette domain-containing protein [Listeria booriae]MBC6305083.1 ATP-binding cassette domain-containing protein [Listeria booriae]
MTFISVKNLSKDYKVFKSEGNTFLNLFKKRDYTVVHAVKNLSFDVKKGDIIGYIGPNGAGKSTTIKLLAGILYPDNGECIIDENSPWVDRKKYVKDIGVMFGQRSQLTWDLPVKDSYDLLRDIYNLTEEDYTRTLAKLVKKLNLEELLHIPVRQLSLGQKVRCELVATFLHEPKLVFLDEPTIGIDIEMKREFQKFVKEINQELGTTIFITTHDLDDIKSLCNRLLIINKGEIFFNGTLEELFTEFYIEEKIFVELLEGTAYHLPDNVKIIEEEGSRLVVSVSEKGMTGKIIKEIVQNNAVVNIYPEQNKIEDIILDIYAQMKIPRKGQL